MSKQANTGVGAGEEDDADVEDSGRRGAGARSAVCWMRSWLRVPGECRPRRWRPGRHVLGRPGQGAGRAVASTGGAQGARRAAHDHDGGGAIEGAGHTGHDRRIDPETGAAGAVPRRDPASPQPSPRSNCASSSRKAECGGGPRRPRPCAIDRRRERLRFLVPAAVYGPRGFGAFLPGLARARCQADSRHAADQASSRSSRSRRSPVRRAWLYAQV